MAAGFIDRVLVWLGLETEEAASAEGTVPVPEASRAAGRRGRVVPLAASNSGASPARAASVPGPGMVAGPEPPAVRVVICHPQSLEEVESVAAHLKARSPVLVSLKRADREAARRIVDFLSGTVYALDGVMRVVGEDVVLCAPGGVDVRWEGNPSE